MPISGTDARRGPWSHVAFLPQPLPEQTPAIDPSAFNAVADARAALAGLDATARQLPEPGLLRSTSVRREAQSTSALEGTFAPLADVIAADETAEQDNVTLLEVVNYIRAADHAFAWVADGRPLTTGLLIDLQGRLVRGTRADTVHASRLRDIQVAIGSSAGAPIESARFIPPPPGVALDAQVRDLVDWISRPHPDIDSVIAAGMAHYLFETLHPFNDGNGRIGRLLIILQLLTSRVLTEPTLTVSPWFEQRRQEYYDHLFGVSARGDWSAWLRFFATGLAAAAQSTADQLHDLLLVRDQLTTTIRASGLRAENATRLVTFALERPIFTVRMVEKTFSLSYARANALVRQLGQLGVLEQYGDGSYNRRFVFPPILEVLLR